MKKHDEKTVVVEKVVGKKKSAPKRKMVIVKEDVEKDVDNNFNDTLVPHNKKSKKILGGKKIP